MAVTKMGHPRRRLSELTSQELAIRAAEYRRMALSASDEATMNSLNVLAARFAVLAARREVEEATVDRSVIGNGQSEVDKLVRLVELAAEDHPNHIRALVGYIKVATVSAADPYLLIGVLIEGAVHILSNRLPRECLTDTALAMQKLLADRLQACGHRDA